MIRPNVSSVRPVSCPDTGEPLPSISAVFWDVGGVLLTNAWDHEERAQALVRFQLDPAEFQQRHEPLVPAFERGELALDEYLDRTVFYQPRSFTREAFRECMFSLSKPRADVLDLARELAGTRKYLMGTINNESRELNAFRIQRFGLREIFSLFVSSCFVGLQKPDERIYRLALEFTQKLPEECCFIDDRPQNLESASRAGIKTVLMKSATQLRGELGGLGVRV